MRELDDQLQLPEDEVATLRMVKVSQGGDAAPAKGAILGIAVLIATHISEVAGCRWEDRLWQNTN